MFSTRLFQSRQLKNSIFSFKKFYAKRVVSFHYTLKDQETGEIYDSTDQRADPFSYVGMNSFKQFE